MGFPPLGLFSHPKINPGRLQSAAPRSIPAAPGATALRSDMRAQKSLQGSPGTVVAAAAFPPAGRTPRKPSGGVCVCPCRRARLLPLRYSHTCSHLARAGHPRRSPRRAPSMLPSFSSSCCCCCLTFLQVTRLSILTLGVFFRGGSAGFSISVAGSRRRAALGWDNPVECLFGALPCCLSSPPLFILSCNFPWRLCSFCPSHCHDVHSLTHCQCGVTWAHLGKQVFVAFYGII